MKPKQEQIEEIERTVLCNCNSHGRGKHCPERISKGLYKVGYRKASDMIDECIEKFLNAVTISYKSSTNKDCYEIEVDKFNKIVADMRKELEK